MITTITTTTTTLISTPQLASAGVVAVATLILLLAVREVLGADNTNNPVYKSITKTSGIVSIALLFAFATIIFTKVAAIV